ncbi:MAG TPA: VWA domain-containing protein [Cellulomonas sp.]
MSFAWPLALLVLLVVPAVLLAWWLLAHRRRQAAVRVTSIALVRSAVPARGRWTRRLPAALLVLALVVLSVGAARPQVQVPVAADGTTVILAFDVSSSMCSTDIDPNRLTVAKEAATEFVQQQAGTARIGLVAFSGTAGLVVPPTDDTDALVEAIDALTTSRGTAIGQAILASIDAIAEVDSSVAATGVEVEADEDADYAAAAIVVLTDGANSQGVEPATAAEQAAARGVRVYTIGFGTDEAAASVCDASEVTSGSAGAAGGSGGGAGPSQTIDEATLTAVADATGGEYYRAENADQLGSALSDLPSTMSVVYEDQDVAAWFAAAGALLVLVAVGLSLWWSRPRVRG